MQQPSIEEQLAAAAWRILSDGRRHKTEAITWAARRTAAALPLRISAPEIRVARFHASRPSMALRVW